MNRLSLSLLLGFLCLTSFDAIAQDDDYKKIEALNWVQSPQSVDIAGRATVNLSDGIKYLAPPDAGKFLELNGNPPSQNSYLLSKLDYSWFAIFYFVDDGYVKDDDKIDDATIEALYKKIKEDDEKDSESRKNANLKPMTLIGWYIKPHYDSVTKTLEWGLRYDTGDKEETINYTVRILGRKGYMRGLLVSSPTTFEADIKDFKSSLTKFNYKPDEDYSAFKQGDKVAEYGLAALVAGGAIAVAAKAGAGFFKAIMIALFAGGAAVIAAIKKFFSRKK